MRMSCPGKVTALAVTMDGVYCAAGIGGIIHIWEVSKYIAHSMHAVLNTYVSNSSLNVFCVGV